MFSEEAIVGYLSTIAQVNGTMIGVIFAAVLLSVPNYSNQSSSTVKAMAAHVPRLPEENWYRQLERAFNSADNKRVVRIILEHKSEFSSEAQQAIDEFSNQLLAISKERKLMARVVLQMAFVGFLPVAMSIALIPISGALSQANEGGFVLLIVGALCVVAWAIDAFFFWHFLRSGP